MLEIRLYREADEVAMRDICLRTGDNGTDATHLYKDRDLLSDIFAIPYTVFDPDLAFVAVNTGQDGEPVVGYIVGTLDSARFARQMREEWLPRVADRHGAPPKAPDWANDAEGTMRWRLHHPESSADPDLADYPAHLHIDLLPEAQGQGCGRALMQTLLGALKERGAQQVHLHVSPHNLGARAFYAKLGFRQIEIPGREPDLGRLGRSTSM